jgi:hypothetical protein
MDKWAAPVSADISRRTNMQCDGFGRMLESSVPQKIKEFYQSRTCWVCGAKLKDDEGTVCYLVHRKSAERAEVNNEPQMPM